MIVRVLVVLVAKCLIGAYINIRPVFIATILNIALNPSLKRRLYYHPILHF